jgi:hypothetical protein
MAKLCRKISGKLIEFHRTTNNKTEFLNHKTLKKKKRKITNRNKRLIKTHKLLRVVMCASSLGIEPVNRFPRRELQYDPFTLKSPLHENISIYREREREREKEREYMLTSCVEPHSGGIEPLR